MTFEREVRTILQARCTSCHSAGGPSPMPLVTYDDVRPWARAVKDQILTRRMPKWSAAHGYGAFAHDPSLTPAEMTMVASWVDGGQPKGTPTRDAGNAKAEAVRRNTVPLALPPQAADATVRTTIEWIGGWDFEPGDPLITSATFTSGDGTPIGTWVAGDAPVQLPEGTGIRVASPFYIQLQRRKPADYERPAAPKRSMLRLLPQAVAPARRVWVEQTACGTPRTGRAAGLLAVRPLLAEGGAARLWLERPGAPPVILGWFRETDARYRRTFWLAHPTELAPESRVASESGCIVELTLVTARR